MPYVIVVAACDANAPGILLAGVLVVHALLPRTAWALLEAATGALHLQRAALHRLVSGSVTSAASASPVA